MMFPIPIVNKWVGAGLCPRPTFQEFRLRLIKGRKNLLLDLPPELRNIIYELAVGKGCKPMYRIPIVSWCTPSLAQVNRRLRNEVIPVYFGRDGGFKLLLKYEHLHPRDGVRLFCEHFSQYLQYVKYLDIDLRSNDVVHDSRGGIAFRLDISLSLIFAESCVAGGQIGSRIGNDETNWDDNIAAAKAFEAAICSMKYASFIFDLVLLARRLKLANRRVQLLEISKSYMGPGYSIQNMFIGD
ncbi:hypothetical protein F4782DRAFT_498313 [Xylaria castorea]|nr:hypothetical protein F4782DRAFT_498313 [Xylaria castorea]